MNSETEQRGNSERRSDNERRNDNRRTANRPDARNIYRALAHHGIIRTNRRE